MPIRAFWIVGHNIDRVEFHEQLCHLRIATASQSPESTKEMHDTLSSALAETMVPDVVVENLDSEGLDFLRTLT